MSQSSYDVIHIVVLMSRIEYMWYNPYTVSSDAATVDAMSDILGVMT